MSKITILILVSVFSTSSLDCFAQQEEQWAEVDVQPTPQGGFAGLYKFINNNLMYTEAALDNKIEGRIMVQYIVSKTGEITGDSTTILEGLGYGLDEQVISLVNNFPKFQPGYVTKWDVYANVRMIMPITYKLPPESSEIWSTRNIKKAQELLNNDLDSALSLMNDAIEANSSLGNNYYMRGLLYQASSNKKLACKDLKKAVKLGFSQELFNDQTIDCSK